MSALVGALALLSACSTAPVHRDTDREAPGTLAVHHLEPELVHEAESTSAGMERLHPTGSPKEEKSEGVRLHHVEPGQTLYRIARLYGVSVRELQVANRLKDGQPISAGQELKVPRAAAGGSPARNPAAAPSSGAPAALDDKEALGWPLRGVLYAHYGRKGKEPHDGIDLSAPAGTPVRAASAGKVLFAGEQQGYGRIAIVDHGHGVITIYAHNGSLMVRTGQMVRRGQVIATVGESGHTSGPHLHFEVRRDGSPVDPLLFLGSPPPGP